MFRFSVLLVLLSLGLIVVANAQDANTGSQTKVAELGWIAGCWSSDVQGTITEETWLAPRGGQMVGVNRMVFPNGKSTFEFLRIADTNKGVVYFASPSGKPATPFALKQAEENKAVFENLENDFPQRIIYQRSGESMEAMIEGNVNGKVQSMKWKWTLSKEITK